jgi:hypothetical protein
MESVLSLALKLRSASSTTSTTNESLDKTYAQTVSNLTMTIVQDVTIAATATMTVDFGGIVNAKLMVFFSDRDLKVNLESLGMVKVGKFFASYGDGDISSAVLENTDGSNAATVKIVLAK